MSKLFWLSFCDGKRPKGEQFLGAAIVPGDGIGDAIRAAWSIGINPGGEVLGHEIPPLTAARVPPHRIGVLMTRSEAEGIDQELLPLPGSAP